MVAAISLCNKSFPGELCPVADGIEWLKVRLIGGDVPHEEKSMQKT